MDSTGSCYDDVYEIANEHDLSFSDDENDYPEVAKPDNQVHYDNMTNNKNESGQTEEDDLSRNPPKYQLIYDSLSYHPYVNPGSQRGGGKRLIYSLSAVIHHLGSGLGGHYICFRRVKDTTGDRWFLMNDSHVKEVPWSTVHQNNIYMVEYELEERNCSCYLSTNIVTHRE